MRKILYFVGIFYMLLACTNRNKSKNFVDITVSSWNHILNDRNGEDYVRLWVNDTLLFSDTFHVDYVLSLRETLYDFRMKVATVPKMNRDSIKIRIKLISLDSILFAGRYFVDTTFYYRVDKISLMNINYYRQLKYFRLVDPVNDPEFFQIE